MSDYSGAMEARPDMLFRKQNTLEFTDKNEKVYSIGEAPPPGYRWRAMRHPLGGPTIEVYVLTGEGE